MQKSIGIGLFGDNGHQIGRAIAGRGDARVLAYAAASAEELRIEAGEATRYDDLDALLADERVELVSLCSPQRSEQAQQAIACLRAGKHVYGEKPSAMREAELDGIIAASRETGMRYHEQAVTAYMPPYRAMRRMIAEGIIGEVAQVYAQKSYPWHDRRAQDEAVDGGLLLQVGVYAARFVEHIAGVAIADIDARESTIGNPAGDCRRAATLSMRLANGGLAAANINYFCPPPGAWHKWGYETLRVWGTRGMIESIDNGRIATLATTEGVPQDIDLNDAGPDLLSMVIEEVATNRDIVPMTLEQELSPTRWILRARAGVRLA